MLITKNNRRRFLFQTSTLAAAALAGPNLLLRGQNAPSRRLNLAVIGATGRGKVDTQNIEKEHNIVALVDVDSTSLETAAKNLSKEQASANAPRLFADFRKMFDEMASDIDGVIVATPDHTHFLAAMWAVQHKKHVCVQKPMCNTIWEVRELHRAAKEAGVMTQMGNQGRTSEGHRLAKEWIEQGVIGTLKEVRLWTNRPTWTQGPLAKKPGDCPPNLAWDLWLSSEPSEPYFTFEPIPDGSGEGAKQVNKRGNSVHPFNWRGWWQFGAGALGDMGCHIMDAAFNVLGRRVPEKIEVASGTVTSFNAPLWSRLVYHLRPFGKLPSLTVSWNDGLKDGKPNKPERDPRVPQDEYDLNSSWMLFIGTDGVIMADTYCFKPMIYPDSKDDEIRNSINNGTFKKTELRSKYPKNPQLEWADAIVNGGTTSSNFDYAAPLSEFVLLGNLAIRAGQTIEWDAKASKVTNAAEANRFIKRPSYRPGWI